jgi:hypothetical protein
MQPRSQNSRELPFAGFNARAEGNSVEMAEAELREIIEEALEDGAVEPQPPHLLAPFLPFSLPSRASCKYSGNLLFHLHAEPELC